MLVELTGDPTVWATAATMQQNNNATARNVHRMVLILAVIAAVLKRSAAIAGLTYQERDCGVICWPGSPARREARKQVIKA